MTRPKLVVFLRDRFVDEAARAQVSLFDRGYLLGDAVFETLRAYDGRLFRAERHVERLLTGTSHLEIALPHGGDEIVHVAATAADRVQASDVYLRITVSRGEGEPGVGFTGKERATFSIIARPWSGYPADAYERGVVSGMAETRRIPPSCLPPDLKTTNYLPNVLARRELDRKGMVEGVVRSVNGQVVSGTASNVFLVHGDVLTTPSASSGARRGVTREAVLELAPGLGVRVEERVVETKEVDSADEIFFTNTLMECIGVDRFEARVMPASRPVTRCFREALRDLVRRETGGG